MAPVALPGVPMTLIIGRSLVVERDHLINGRVGFGSPPDDPRRYPERPHLGVQPTKIQKKRKFEFERQLPEVKRLFPSGGPNSRS